MEKFVIVGDIHLHLFNEFAKPAQDSKYVNTRLENTVKALKEVFEYARFNNATLIITGDVFHERGKVRTEVFNAAYELFAEYTDVKIIMIRGNHDMVSNSFNSQSSLDIFDTFENIHLVKTLEQVYTNEGNQITAVSYGEEYAEAKQFIKDNPGDILIGHLGVAGSKGAGHSKLDGAFTVADLEPENFEEVFLGHYHRGQMLADNVRYLGTIVSTNFSEPEEKGYWTFSIDDHAVKDLKFVKLDYPRFITTSIEEFAEISEEERNFNYYRLTGSKEQVDKLEQLTEVPDTVRLDINRVQTEEARIEISTEDTPVTIAEKWAEENDSDHSDIIKEQMQKVVSGGHYED